MGDTGEKQHLEINISNIRGMAITATSLYEPPHMASPLTLFIEYRPLPKSEDVPPSLANCSSYSVVCEKAISRNDENVQI